MLVLVFILLYVMFCVAPTLTALLLVYVFLAWVFGTLKQFISNINNNNGLLLPINKEELERVRKYYEKFRR